ncbi:MAG: CsgE family curli-type amyloid fiber assembly protein [Saprospiraceae bacterium]
MENAFFNKKNMPPNSIWDSIVLTFFEKKLTLRWGRFLKSTIVIIYLTLCSSISMIYALDSTSVKVWIDFIEENDTVFVKALGINMTEDSISLKWEMEIHKETQAGFFDKKLTGEIVAEPFYPHIISETKIDLKKQEYFVIIFKVFNLKNDLVNTDTLISTQVDSTLVQPSPPEPPIAKKALPNARNNLDAIEIDGLILDETRSKIGRDFYEIFYNRWNPPAGAKDFLITIREMPSRGLGARISIEVNENVVLYRFLQPRNGLIEEEANFTISYIKSYLTKNENLKQDMEAGDTMGSGIY